MSAENFEATVAAEFPDRRVVQCNLTTGQPTAVAGARAYVVRGNPGNGDERIVVLLRSRSGRWIEKWQDIRTLNHFRIKTLPVGHPRYGDERLWDYEPELMVANLIAAHAREVNRRPDVGD